MTFAEMIPEPWRPVLAEELAKPYIADLEAFVAEEYAAETVFPPKDEVFTGFRLTPPDDVRVLVLGQDPYHGEGQAHGLCFSVRRGVPLPPSLKNIYKELASDLDILPPSHGYLAHWAEQGVLMLNAVLTVRAHEANSHRKKGWEQFTDAVIRAVNEKPDPVVFVLWGNPAQKKTPLIDTSRHRIIASAHPSPLSARRGFFGSRPFSRVNEFLTGAGRGAVDWRIPDELGLF